MTAVTQSQFAANLKRYYSFYTGGFVAFVILVGILEQMGVPNKILGYIFLFATIALYAGIGFMSKTADVGECSFLAAFNGPESRDKASLGREATKERLAKAVNRLNAQPAAPRVEHFCKECPGLCPRLGAGGFAQRFKVPVKQVRRQADPSTEDFIDAVGHFRSAGLGKCQAQDRFRWGIMQEQASAPAAPSRASASI